jgi:lamin B
MEALKKKLVEELHKHLEDETFAKIDLGSIFESLQKEMSLKEQVYNQELTKILARHQVEISEIYGRHTEHYEQVHNQELTKILARHQVEISEIYGRLTEQYEAKLQQSLQKMRDQHETQTRAKRDRIVRLFQNKVCEFMLWHIFGFGVVNMGHAVA